MFKSQAKDLQQKEISKKKIFQVFPFSRFLSQNFENEKKINLYSQTIVGIPPSNYNSHDLWNKVRQQNVGWLGHNHD